METVCHFLNYGFALTGFFAITTAAVYMIVLPKQPRYGGIRIPEYTGRSYEDENYEESENENENENEKSGEDKKDE